MIARLALFLLLALAPVAAPAQGLLDGVLGSAPAEETPPEGEAPADPAAAPEETVEGQPLLLEEEAEAWHALATRAEGVLARDDSSQFALTRLRAELMSWRDRFLGLTNVNSTRLASIAAQLAALGPVPESGIEAGSVTARREALIEQQHFLEAPQRLAAEAHARANGLIGELDAAMLARETAALTQRGPLPLRLDAVGEGLFHLIELVGIVAVETRAGLSQRLQTGMLWQVLPRSLGYLAFAVALLGYGRRWVTRRKALLEERQTAHRPLALFLLSLVQIGISLIGLYLLARGLDLLGIFGLRGNAIIKAIPAAGFAIIFAWWLSRQVFPTGERPGALGYDEATRRRGRIVAQSMGWIMAASIILIAPLMTMELSIGARAAVEWPMQLLLGLSLAGLGLVIATPREEALPDGGGRGRLRFLIGRLCILVGIAAPAIGLFGYGAAAGALITPAILTLGIFGVVLLLQGTVGTLGGPLGEETPTGGRALIPVLVSFVIYLAALPVLALAWGAQTDTLREIWARFREGLSIGETRLSPTDFLTFALVFALGYLATRFLQGTLRRSVLPRTKLDLGGQNAIVAGVGYVGIILAAIIAITSAGINLSSLAIVAGALSVGIGFGLQNIVSNFVSGIILLIERPVSEGDWIEVGGQMGYVRSISVRSTRIETFDRTDVIVPNADLVSNQVTNWTRGNLIGRVIVPVGVAYGSDVEKVKTILREIAEAHPLVIMTPPPAVLFQGFGADSLDFEIRAILRDVNYVLQTKSEMNTEIDRRFREAGIEIPFAQRDIWLRNPEVLRDVNDE